MNSSIGHGWITEHRGWEDFFAAGLGILIVISPSILAVAPTPAVAISAGLIGVVITMLALLENISLARWEEFLEAGCGLWVCLSPLVLGYGGALRLAHFVLGGAVIILALLELWQDRNRRFAE